MIAKKDCSEKRNSGWLFCHQKVTRPPWQPAYVYDNAIARATLISGIDLLRLNHRDHSLGAHQLNYLFVLTLMSSALFCAVPFRRQMDISPLKYRPQSWGEVRGAMSCRGALKFPDLFSSFSSLQNTRLLQTPLTAFTLPVCFLKSFHPHCS